MKNIRYVCYGGTVREVADEVKQKLVEDIKSGIDINKPSVEVITYKDFLSKNIDDKNYYNVIRGMTENILASSIDSAEDMVDRIYDITDLLENNQLLNRFDLSFCELLLNPFAFSFYYTTEESTWPKGVIFCLNDRLDKDVEFVWGNEPLFYWLGAQAILFDNVDELRNSVKGMFKKISSEDTFNKFKEIFPKFKSLADKYLIEHKQELFYDDSGDLIPVEDKLMSSQLDYLENLKQHNKEQSI